MSSPANRFTALQKIAVFLIAIGADKTREVLAELDFDTLGQINRTLAELGPVSAREKAAVMIEFGDLFFRDIPLSSKIPNGPSPAEGKQPDPKTASPIQGKEPDPRTASPTEGRSTTPPGQVPRSPGAPDRPRDRVGLPSPDPESRPASPSVEPSAGRAAARALEHLRRHVDPREIDWGRAGYDFGEGFQGSGGSRRR